MGKHQSEIDVLVLGSHPSTYVAAALIQSKNKIRVAHCTIPGEADRDPLVLINPALFALHASLEKWRRKLELQAVYGVQFIADDRETKSEHRAKSPLAFVASYKEVRAASISNATDEAVEFLSPKTLRIRNVDEAGVELTAGKATLRPKVLVVGGTLAESDQKRLGLPESWEREVVHRYTWLKLPAAKWIGISRQPSLVMSLNLRDTFCWAWLLPGASSIQLAVVQHIELTETVKPLEFLAHWGNVLRAHNILSGKGELPLKHAVSEDLPLAGALAHEGVANRTVLIGPAGGFFSACSEDIYPNVWSAVFAADAVRKALKETHLQDALQPYRHKWRTTLGDYLRGPQQNLRFLLPLVYRNPVMTTRLAESILQGKSVVR